MKNLLTSLIVLMAASGCAQILGADEYEVDPSAFEESDASVDEDPTDDEGDDDSDDDATDDEDPDDADDDVTDDDVTDDDEDTDDDGPDEPPNDDPAEDDVTDDDSDDPSELDDDVDASVPDDTDDDTDDDVTDDDDITDDDVTDDDDITDDDDVVDDDDTDDDVTDDAEGGVPTDPCDLPELGTCNTYAQCGCDEGQMCTVGDFSTGETACVAEGTRAPGEPCQYIEECQAGYLCLFGVCSAFCDGDDASCTADENAACIQGQTDTGPVPGIFGCTRTCDPVNPALQDSTYMGCAAGSNCYSAESGQSFCLAPAGDGRSGDPCGTTDAPDLFACAPGFACVLFTDGPSCARNCEVGSDDCGGGRTCTAYTPASYAVDREIGYCDPSTTCPDLQDTCDPITQCGCEDGDRCAVIDESDGTLGCVPEGAATEGNQCAPDPYSCAAGECLSYASEEDGVCVPYCYTADDCPNVNGGCIPRTWGEPGICARGCDPRDPTSNETPFMSCGAGQTCVVWNEYSYCAPQYATGEVGTACTLDDECLGGLGCGVTVDDARVCGTWCEVGGTDCNYAAQCLPHADDADLGPFIAAGVPMGICELPTYSETAQVDTAVPDGLGDDIPAALPASSTLEVPASITTLTRVVVEVNITHPWVEDLDVTLVGPDGTRVMLFDGSYAYNDPSGDNLHGTVFTDDAAEAVQLAYAPFTGEFTPFVPLATFLDPDDFPDGYIPSGTWTLEVLDTWIGDAGTFDSWRLVLY